MPRLLYRATEARRFGAGPLEQRRQSVDVVVVRVRDDDMRQRAVADRAQDRREMRRVGRAGIDQHDLATLPTM